MSGLFGIVSSGNCSETLFYGTDYHSHMGTEKAGLVVMGTQIHRRIRDISLAQFKSKFAAEYKTMPGRMGIGVVSDLDPQPMLISTHFGEFAVATMGRILNTDELVQALHKKGTAFSEISDTGINRTEIVARMIAMGKNPEDGIAQAMEQIQGSCSLLLLTRNALYAARDNLGRSPLVLAKNGGVWAVSTESCAFSNLGFLVERDLEPGEILRIESDGVHQMRPGFPRAQVCAFLWIYTGYPASQYEGISVEGVRQRCGASLARADSVEADLAAGVPDSGTGHAIGYAIEAGIPYQRPLVKYTPGYGRSYTPPSQEIRDLVAEMKLIPIRDVIEGKRVKINGSQHCGVNCPPRACNLEVRACNLRGRLCRGRVRGVRVPGWGGQRKLKGTTGSQGGKAGRARGNGGLAGVCIACCGSEPTRLRAGNTPE